MRILGARRLALVLSAALLLAGSIVYASQYSYLPAVEVAVDGRVVATVADEQAVQAAVQELQQRASQEAGFPVSVANPPRLSAVRVPRDQPLADAAALVARLESLLRYRAQGVAIRVAGRTAVHVATAEQAEAALDGVRAQVRARIEARPGGRLRPGERVEILSLEIAEPVQIVPAQVDPAQIRDAEAAAAILLRGTDEVREHVVRRGETLWSIAEGAGMSVQALRAANPQLADPDRLQVGQRLNLIVPKPYVTVRSVERRTYTVEIPFRTRTVYDEDLWPWERVVRSPGAPGKKQVVEEVRRENGEVTARDVIGETVLAQPREQVVVAGRRAVRAQGTGTFAWPMAVGQISSWFGWRRGDFHEGVDIAAPYGSPVQAADAGVVVRAGWYGAYGRAVVIEHGGGRSTLYGHLATISVKVGQRVSKGQTIGTVGCSGRCTGPHLHFEVRINGRAVNPMGYFR